MNFVRTATIKDLLALTRCELEFPLSTRTPLDLYGAWGCEAIVAQRCGRGQEVRGSLWYRENGGRLEIVSLSVLKSAQRMGLGTALMVHAHDIGQRMGLKKAFLDVVQHNTRARELYTNLGYRNVARTRPGVYRMQVEL